LFRRETAKCAKLGIIAKRLGEAKSMSSLNLEREVRRTVTFDSTSRPDEPPVLKAVDAGWHVAFASVSVREARGTNFEASMSIHGRVPELGVWGESSWGARWADRASSQRLRSILAIVSNGSFPKSRGQLTKGESHQLRDAMILEAHAAAHRDVFVTADARAFIRNGRREQLEALLQTRILNPAEFEAELDAEHLTQRP
jgi:hypothetical protein